MRLPSAAIPIAPDCPVRPERTVFRTYRGAPGREVELAVAADVDVVDELVLIGAELLDVLPPHPASAGTSTSTSTTAHRRSTPRTRGRRLPGPGLFDPPLHVELGVEVRRIRVPVFHPLAAEKPRQHLDVVAVELRVGHPTQFS